jgi:hypothetical protein
MRSRWFLFAPVLVLAVAVSGAAFAGSGNVRVTKDDTAGSYLTYNGTSDATMAACSTGKRSQNEPTIAVDPHNTQVVVSGANDYCAAIENGDVWAGYYRTAAHPEPRRLATTGVVVVKAARHLLLVVGLLTKRQLRNAQHPATPTKSKRAGTQMHPRCAKRCSFTA